MEKVTVVIDEGKCNGCGQCVTACHEGVIRIVNGKAKVVNSSSCDGLGACIGECPEGAITLIHEQPAPAPCGCPGAKAMSLRPDREKAPHSAGSGSQLRNWPVQLHLINPDAPFLKGADLLIAADCVGFAYPELHGNLLANKVLINFCPKLDQGLDVYTDKLTRIFKGSNIKSITVAHMEVPCCLGLLKITQGALEASGANIPLSKSIVSIRGELI
jgi:NAD-dependent dihydropyrimidine dehydrogenase PreA subunit